MEQKLIEAAVAAVIGALTKAAAEPALGAGRRVWDWLNGKVAGDEARTAAAVEAEPDKPSAPEKVSSLLKDLLHDNPQAEQELRALLEAGGGVQAITQTANVAGDHNKIAQVAATRTRSTSGNRPPAGIDVDRAA